jgi:hypothetical protein
LAPAETKVEDGGARGESLDESLAKNELSPDFNYTLTSD